MTFVDDVAQALVDAGRRIEVDEEMATIDVSSHVTENVLAVIRPLARAVTFYVVHPEAVPADRLAAVSELAVRATADLLDAALELDLATGAVAVRYGLVLGDLGLSAEGMARFMDAALEVVETAAARYAGPIDEVLTGAADPRAAAVAARTAPVDELQAEVDELQARVDGR